MINICQINVDLFLSKTFWIYKRKTWKNSISGQIIFNIYIIRAYAKH